MKYLKCVFLETRWIHSPIKDWTLKSFALLQSVYTSWKFIQNGKELPPQLMIILTRQETVSFQSKSWHRFAHSISKSTPTCASFI